MKFKNVGKIFFGPFFTTIAVLVIIVVSVILVMISQTNGVVEQSTESYAGIDMQESAGVYSEAVWFSLTNGIDDLDLILTSDIFSLRIVFVTDADGNIIGKSNLAKYSIQKDNIFDHFAGGEYLDDISESDVRELLKNGENGSFSVYQNQKEFLVFRPMGDGGLRFFYMLHQSDVDRIYSSAGKYVKSVRSLGAAYITILLGLVVLMGSYIFFVAKTSELKITLSNLKARRAQEQARVFTDITRVLAQSYEKIYYVNLSTDHYKVFASTTSETESPLKFEGDDFWNIVIGGLLDSTVEDDRDIAEAFLDRNVLPDRLATEGYLKSRFRMYTYGVPAYYSLNACPTELNGQRYLVLGIKNVDATVSHDVQQLAEKEAALRRVEIYRGALLDNMLAYLELNITDGRVVDGPFIADEKKRMMPLERTPFSMPDSIDEMAMIWGKYLYENGPEQSNYIKNNSRAHLIDEFEKGHSIVEFDFEAKWNDGSVRGIRQNYYMSRREKDGDIVALCVLYDMTEKIERDREIKNLTTELLQSRIKISTGQMQPHFLYNVLGSIREIILEDPQYASDLICDFTTHLRACIKSLSNDDLIPFYKEVENIKAYVNIEKMRFGDRMQVEFDIGKDNFDVVPLSIQPLVENAIRHGLYPKTDGTGIVRISSFTQNGYSVIVVKDNGVGFDYEKVIGEIRDHKRDSAGLLNLTLRLEKIMDAKVYFDSKIGEGTTVTVLIPQKEEGAQE